MLLGFKPDYLEIEFDGNKRKIEKVIVGIYDKEITKNQEYTGLVGLDLLEEERGSSKLEIVSRKEWLNEYTGDIKI